MFGRRKKVTVAQAPAHFPPLDIVLAETVAGHFAGSEVVGRTAHLGLAGLTIMCEVHKVDEIGAYSVAHLYFQVAGGGFGETAIFASVSGYESSPHAAIVAGGCNWACAFGPVLRSGLTGVPEPGPEEFEATLDGRRYRVVLSMLDRMITFGSSDEAPGRRLSAARTRLGGTPWLTPKVLASQTLPLLTSGHSTLLSVFVSDASHGRTVEVKVNGSDWSPCTAVFAGAEPEPEGAVTLLRELAVLTPLEPAPPLTRHAVQRTLAGIDPATAKPWQAAGWQGWQTHQGVLGAPLTAREVADLEAQTGPLPADYKRFLTEVAGSGAGPGYGLLRPQLAARCLPLAHAGCGVVWVMLLVPEFWGRIDADASSSDGTSPQIADSFTAFYGAWLDASIRDHGPWTQWDAGYCATASVLSQLLEGRDDDFVSSLPGQVLPGAISLTTGSGYLPADTPIDPCHGCVALAAQLGLGPEVFAPGVLTS